MTIQKPPQGNRHHSGKSEARISGKLIPLVDPEARNSKWMWIFLGMMLIVLAVLYFSGDREPALAPVVKTAPASPAIENEADGIVDCSKLTTDQCADQMRFERKNRQWLDSPEGRDTVRAVQMTAGTPDNAPEK